MSDNASPSNPVIDDAALAALKARTNGTADTNGTSTTPSQAAASRPASRGDVAKGEGAANASGSDDDAALWRELVEKISEYSGLDADDITEQTKISESGITSLSLIEISIRLEDAFGVCLDDETVFNFDTFGDLFRYVKEHRK